MVAIHQDLFGAPRQGRMARLAFVIYASAIQLAVLVYVIWVGVAAGLAEQAVDLDLEKAQQQLSDFLSPSLLVFTGVFLTALIYAQFNIVAKRVRDIGLPGWWVILAYVILRVAISAVGFPWVGLLFEVLAMLLLCFVASDTVDRQGDS